MILDRQLVAERYKAVGASNAKRERLFSSAKSLLRIANQRPVDERAYLDALYSTYLLGRRTPRHSHKAEQPDELRDRPRVEARFRLEPIEIGGRQGSAGDGRTKGARIHFREFDSFAPLYLRDALSHMTFSDVEIIDISFGCLRVVYELAYPEASSQINKDMMFELSQLLHISSLKVGDKEMIGN